VRLLDLPVVTDIRGTLSFGQYDTHLPFLPRRYFVVYDVPGKEVRGEHAHRALHQVLVCLRGSLAVMLDDGTSRDEVLLDGPQLGLYVPPMVWTSQFRYSSDAMLLVLASDVYDAADYIRSYDDFLAAGRRV
jgi:dTDP-4-dehydrorhamnose 3,5-epimerase-like enzyme